MKKRLLACLMSLCLLIGLFPTTALAEDGTFEVNSIAYAVTGESTVKVVSKTGLYSGDIQIPETITYQDKQYTVHEIGSSAFARCVDLGSVTLPDSIRSIGKEAFAYISNGSNLFSITLPEGVESLDEKAFAGSRKLTSIHIPSTVTSMGWSVFANCNNLKTVTFAENSQLTELPGQCFWLCALQEISLPASLKKIGGAAFASNGSLKTVRGLDGVTDIGEKAFQSTSLAGEMTIPSSVTNIGKNAFSDTDITKVGFAERSEAITLGSAAFAGCDSLTEITLSVSITSLPDRLLESCPQLTTVTIPEGIQIISASAFKDCTSLASITIPSSVTALNATAFSGCTALKEIHIAEGSQSFLTENGVLYDKEKTKVLRVFNYADATFEIPDSIVTVAQGALAGTSITAITFPENSTRTAISDQMFSGCTNLTSVTLPSNLQTIGANAFFGCTGLHALIIPDGVTQIGANAFFKSGLTSVTLPERLSDLGRSAFAQCTALEKVEFRSELKDIPDSAFQYCSQLTEISLPDGVETIGSDAFSSCKLKNITVPASVKEIGTSAFTLANDAVCIMKPEAFSVSGSGSKNIYSNSGNVSNLTVYCPTAAVEHYKTMLRNNATIYGYRLALTNTTLTVGDSYTLDAVIPAEAEIVCGSSNLSAASVSDKGGEITVSAVAVGTTDITVNVQVNGIPLISQTCAVTVTAKPVPATSITFSSETVSVLAGRVVQLSVTLEPTDTTDVVTWTSSDETIATVGSNGLVTAISAGQAVITASAGDKKAECVVMVQAPYVPIPPVTPVQPVNPTPDPEPDPEPTPGVWSNPYADVAASDWYYDAVAYVSANGLMTGTTASTFAPNDTMTRAMVWTVLARMEGQSVEGGSPWYALAQSWAVGAAVSDGTVPNDSITREQLITMLYRQAGSPVVGVSELAKLGQFSDGVAVSDWAQSAMAWAVSTGILTGDNGALNPQASATRAQVAAILMRFVERLTKS